MRPPALSGEAPCCAPGQTGVRPRVRPDRKWFRFTPGRHHRPARFAVKASGSDFDLRPLTCAGTVRLPDSNARHPDHHRLAAALLLTAPAPHAAPASGHGPVFGGAPPTLGKGGWQLDQAWMGRLGQGRSDDEQMLRTMLSVGITEDLQISASLPDHPQLGHLHAARTAHVHDVVHPGLRSNRRLAVPTATLSAPARGSSRRSSSACTVPLQQYRQPTACGPRLRSMCRPRAAMRRDALLLGERRLSVLWRA